MDALQESVEFIANYKAANPSADKAAVQAAWVDWAAPQKMRSVFVGNGFAIRFSEAMTGGFSNTVLSLSALAKHDAHPFVVAVVRRSSVDLMLANATFLKKVSHSSQMLRTDNVKGSFNGSDIMMTEFEGTPNTPERFDELYAVHSAFTWEENLERLVEATNEIVARNIRFQPSRAELDLILDAPARFTVAVQSEEFASVERDLTSRMDKARGDILAAAQIDNVNIRGNAIEQLLTGEGNAHELGDLVQPLANGELVIDVKTKLLDRASAPKAYNVDKLLRLLAEPGSVLAFFMVGVDLARGQVSGRLLTVLDDALRESTVVQHHWAGRGSRGVTQLSGNFGKATSAGYQTAINSDDARRFLRDLVNL